MDGQQKGTLVDCYPLEHTKDLLTLVHDIQRYIPSVSIDVLSTSNDIEATVHLAFGCFPQPSSRNLQEFQVGIKRLRSVENLFCCFQTIENNLTHSLQHYDTPLDGPVATVLQNLRCLRQHILEVKICMLDACPKGTADIIRSTVKLVRIFL